jgi:4,5-DOPA dioxygenase extradiol
MLNELKNLAENGRTMPVLFIGHGSPMNAVEENEFIRGWQKSVENIGKPKAIVVISAHWETRGIFVTAMEKPRTIHDFYGFPQKLFDVQYPANGSLETANLIGKNANGNQIGLDKNWGLDHGAWSVLVHMFPNAEIPVL